ncbi:MAG TPA: glycosyltransferase family 39 protein [Chthoniobacterales bacterium]
MSDSSDNALQRLVHSLEQGALAGALRIGLFCGAVVLVAWIYLSFGFRGLEAAEGIDQAQIAREIARGNGFTTLYIRPLAVAQLKDAGKPIQAKRFPETYHAPLNPYLESLVLLPFKEAWNPPEESDQTYAPADQRIAALAVALFVLSIAVNYFTVKRMFGDKLAAIVAGLITVCVLFWEFTSSGLPQILMVLLFSLVFYAFSRALESRETGGRYGLWLAGIGALFGLLALAHGLTVWIFLGALVYISIAFKPRGLACLIPLAVFAALYAPWIVRNYQVTGTPFGIAWYAEFGSVGNSVTGWMRQSSTDLGSWSFNAFRGKIQSGLVGQLGRIYALLGGNVAAAMFFVSLLHRFRKTEIASFRWAVLLMWGFAAIGMSVAGLPPENNISENQLHVLFIPLMIPFGMAFTLNLWSRLEIEYQWARVAFITMIFVLSGAQLIMGLIPSGARIVWPPYAPRIIQAVGKWMTPGEMVASDMPWAVSWYADRKSLLLPATLQKFNELNDFNELGLPINGLFLTPVTGNLAVSDVKTGEYKAWSAIILRDTDSIKMFPLKFRLDLPPLNQCVFYADSPRWATSAQR